MAENCGIAAVNSVRIKAPAKINLGLAVLGKRADGYHEIDTIMAMIDLADTITVHQVDVPGITIAGMDDVPVESNLITKAIRGWCEVAHQRVAFQIDVDKHIPFPAGLGGGSSDAAAAILALDALYPGAVPESFTHHLAASLGADCPFFLGAACARATGIGTTLASLPAPEGWAVIVVPPVNLNAKTAALYAALSPDDYGTHAQIDEIQSALMYSRLSDLPNSFTHAAQNSFPHLSIATSALDKVAGTWSLSGAGPAIFAIASSATEASQWQKNLCTMLPHDFRVMTARFLQKPPRPEMLP